MHEYTRIKKINKNIYEYIRIYKNIQESQKKIQNQNIHYTRIYKRPSSIST